MINRQKLTTDSTSIKQIIDEMNFEEKLHLEK